MTGFIGLSITVPTARGGGVSQATGAVALANFSRDRILYDSGVALGGSTAAVPLSGTGTADAVVEARAVSLDDGGATGTGWAAVATIAADGRWSGSLTVGRSASWYRAEVRLRDEPFVTATAANRFGVGHVIAIWGQSEVARMFDTGFSLVAPEPVLAPDMVQMIWQDLNDGLGPRVRHLATGDTHTAAFAAMANALIASRPGEKFAVIHHSVPGTSPAGLVNDLTDTTETVPRLWSDDLALHAFATADGQKVGLAAMSWFAAPRGWGSHYGDAMFPLLTGKLPGGAALAFPAEIPDGATSSYHADHWFGEIYDSATRWVGYGPHRFDITQDMTSARSSSTGAADAGLVKIEECRTSWRAMLANPNAGGLFLPHGAEPLAYQNGVSDGTGGWTDIAHPSGDSADGLPRLARLTALSVLRAGGMAGWPVPEFDQCQWQPDGSFVEVWCSAGPVTTTRIARGEPALGTAFAHWTDVFGWQINGLPAKRAEIVGGRVRIHPDAAAFVAGDAISFGEGGATGMIAFPEDALNGAWKNLPIVDVGAPAIEGISVRPLPAAAILANTITGAATFTVTGGTWFSDPATLGTNSGDICLKMRLSVPAGAIATALTLAAIAGGSQMKLEILTNGALRLNLRDGASTVLVSSVSTAAALYAFGSAADVVLSVSLGGLYARLWVNGAQALDLTLPANSGSFQGSRNIMFLSATATGSAIMPGTVTELAVWKAATPTGAAPAGAPYHRITGPAALANADGWKRGTDAA